MDVGQLVSTACGLRTQMIAQRRAQVGEERNFVPCPPGFSVSSNVAGCCLEVWLWGELLLLSENRMRPRSSANFGVVMTSNQHLLGRPK